MCTYIIHCIVLIAFCFAPSLMFLPYHKSSLLHTLSSIVNNAYISYLKLVVFNVQITCIYLQNLTSLFMGSFWAEIFRKVVFIMITRSKSEGHESKMTFVVGLLEKRLTFLSERSWFYSAPTYPYQIYSQFVLKPIVWLRKGCRFLQLFEVGSKAFLLW